MWTVLPISAGTDRALNNHLCSNIKPQLSGAYQMQIGRRRCLRKASFCMQLYCCLHCSHSAKEIFKSIVEHQCVLHQSFYNSFILQTQRHVFQLSVLKPDPSSGSHLFLFLESRTINNNQPLLATAIPRLEISQLTILGGMQKPERGST